MGLPLIKTESGFQTIVENKAYAVAHDHPEYQTLLDSVFAGDVDTFLSKVSLEKAIQTAYSGTQVTVAGGQVFYGGVPIDNGVARRIIGFLEEGLPVEPMVKFLQNLMDNPSKRAVDELYSFLEHRAMPITDDGHFLAYKAVRSTYKDKHSNTFDNSVGQVLEMPRNMVDEDRTNHCSQGFHVGSLEYAGPKGWFTDQDDRIMIVKVNPRDAVSVPSDHGCQKLRVCRYEVIGEYERELPDTFVDTSHTPDVWDEDEDDYDEIDEDVWDEDEDDYCW